MEKKTNVLFVIFPLHINPEGLEYDDSEMPYTDFLIKFFRNIYSHEDFLKSENLENFESYYATFTKHLNTIFTEDALKNSTNFNNIYFNN